MFSMLIGSMGLTRSNGYIYHFMTGYLELIIVANLSQLAQTNSIFEMPII